MKRLLSGKTALLAALILIVVIAAVSVSQAHAIKNQLNDWKLLPQPEKLTELYFNNSSSLPTTYTPKVSQAFSFTVHNIEYQTEDYKYTVSEQSNSGNQTQLLTSGSFVLGQNQYKTKDIAFDPVDLGSRVNIKVNLVNVNESIDYWFNKG